MQDLPYCNAVFPIKDDNGVMISAELQGTSSKKRFKGTATLQGCYGFKWQIGREISSLCLFESAVDLLSMVDYYTNIDKGKPLTNVLCVSMSGLKPSVMQHYSELYPTAKLHLCIDNDSAAQTFLERNQLAARHFAQPLQMFAVKDWNELLQRCRGRDGEGGDNSRKVAK